MRRNEEYPTTVAGWLWYVGSAFNGFQQQAQGRTVQSELHQALAQLGLSRVKPSASGRTDKGVHARMLPFNFKLDAHLECEDVRQALNGLFPQNDMGCLHLVRAPKKFHAQWQALGKEYRYRFCIGHAAREWEPFVWQSDWLHKVDLKMLNALLPQCLGPRDFIAFHEKSSVQKLRTLSKIELVDLGKGIFELRLIGDSFARYQVRYLVGSLLAVAASSLPAELFLDALQTGRAISGVKAPAQGLVLWEVFYPAPVDPFSTETRTTAPGLPQMPPFVS